MFRILMLAAAIAALSWFQFVNTASARDVGRNAHAHLSGADARSVRHVPEGVGPADAHALRELVAAYLESGAGPVAAAA